MKVYTFSEARQKLASLLSMAKDEGEVRVKRKDGSVFAIIPVTYEGSPLDTDGVQTSITADEIVQYVREGREK